MFQGSRVEANMKKLQELIVKNPSATHIYMRRVGKDNLVIDIPITHAPATIRQWPLWEVVSSNKEMDDEVEKLFKEPDETIITATTTYDVIVPLKPSESDLLSEETKSNSDDLLPPPVKSKSVQRRQAIQKASRKLRAKKIATQ